MKKTALAFSLIVFGLFGLLSVSQLRPVDAQTRKTPVVKQRPSPSQRQIGKGGPAITPAQREALKAHREASHARVVSKRAAYRASRPAGTCPMGQVNAQGIYNLYDYPRCGAEITDENDSPRIQRAIDDAWADAYGGIVFLPEGEYFIQESLIMYSGITILGANALAYGKSALVLQDEKGADNVFDIGEGISDITIKDVGILSEAKDPSELVGIYIHGGTTTDPAYLPDFQFHFDHIVFQNLGKGIYVYGEDLMEYQQWQLEGVRLENCTFNTPTAIHLDTHNTSWYMSNSAFVTQQGSTAIDLEKCGWITMVDLTAFSYNWTPPKEELRPQGSESTFIKVGQHQGVTVQGSATEHMDNSLVVDYASRDSVITLINNRMQNKIDLENAAQVASTGNVYSTGLVVVGESTKVFSTGDRFCPDQTGDPDTCSQGDFVDPGGDVVDVAFRTGIFQRKYCPYGVTCREPGDPGMDPLYTYPDYIEMSTTSAANFHNHVRIENFASELYTDVNDPRGAGYIPVLTVSSATNNVNKPLLRLGTNDYFYTYERNGGDGALEVDGNQAGYSSYRFKTTAAGPATKTFTINNDGSITLQSILYANLGSPANGTMTYCSDCQQTSTCAGSGSGAFAKRINGGWVCD